jgi:hypothetical protein
MTRFTALDKEVRVAGVRSKLWALLGTAAAVCAAALVAPHVVDAVLPLVFSVAH